VDDQVPSKENRFRLFTEGEKETIGLVEDDHRRIQLENLAMSIGSTSEPVLCFHTNIGDRPTSVSSYIQDLNLGEVDTGSDPRSMVELHKAIGDLLDPASSNYRKDAPLYTIPDLLARSKEYYERLERGIGSYRHRKGSEVSEYSGRITDDGLLMSIRDRFDSDHVWSVTQFETFRVCPYLFFIRYILGIQEMEDLEPGIPPEKKGLIFHEVVDRFYDEFRRKHHERVDETNLPVATRSINSIALDVIDKHPNKGPYWDALKDLFMGYQKEKGLLQCFLEVEAGYKGPFLVDFTEKKFGMKEGGEPAVQISLIGEGSGMDTFRLRGSIDRTDVLRTREGDLDFIWDYKTGSRDVDKDSVQVPLYLAALRRLFPDHYPAGGGYYYVRKRGSITRQPKLGDAVWDGSVKDVDDLRSHIRDLDSSIQDSVQRCLEMIDTIRSGDLSPHEGCRDRYCKFLHLCRRGDR
jgi:RecB family exonuclease